MNERWSRTASRPAGTLQWERLPDAPEASPQLAWTGWPPVVDGRGKVQWAAVWAAGSPLVRGLPREVRSFRWRNLPNLARGLWRVSRPRLGRGPLTGFLHLDVTTLDGRLLPYGLVSLDLVTLAGANALVDAFQPGTAVELEDFHFHGVGTGPTTASVSDQALGVEANTALSPAGQRANGTTGEQAGNTNIYLTVGILTFASAIAVTEWGLFSTQPVESGTLLDHATFSQVNVAIGNTLAWSYSLVFTPGG